MLSMYEFWNSVWKREKLYNSKNETTDVPWDIKTEDLNLKDFLKQYKESLNILEIGCGNGNDAYYMSKKGHNVTAIDISDAAIDEAKTLYKNNNLNFIVSDLFTFENEKKYDLVFDRGCFHNFGNQSYPIYFEKVYSLLKDKGNVLLLTGNYNQQIQNNVDILPNFVYLQDIEKASYIHFCIKNIKEIILKQNSNYVENPLGWMIVLEKKDRVEVKTELQEVVKNEQIIF